MKFEIIPAIITNSQEELDAAIKKAETVANIAQIDIMDGRFVENKASWFDFEVPETKMLLEAHLMVNDPVDWIEKNYQKVDLILSPIETTKDPKEIIDLVKSKGKKVGFVLNPETQIDTVTDYLNEIDQILIMTVVPGRYGAPFVPEALGKVRELRKLAPNLDIEVDGGVTDKTIQEVIDAGANLLVSGSYLMKADNIKENFQILNNKLE